jgi:hypothetical protein
VGGFFISWRKRGKRLRASRVRFEGLRLQAQPSSNRPFAVRAADSAPEAHTKEPDQTAAHASATLRASLFTVRRPPTLPASAARQRCPPRAHAETEMTALSRRANDTLSAHFSNQKFFNLTFPFEEIGNASRRFDSHGNTRHFYPQVRIFGVLGAP